MATYFVGGIKVDEYGVIQTSLGPTHNFVNGVPVDVDGNVVVTNADPVSSDPFLAGQRISNAESAVYLTEGN
jgi:hypothetical protein